MCSNPLQKIRLVLGWQVWGLLISALALSMPVSAADKTARDLMPVSVIGYLEVPQPQKVLDTIADHPLTKQVLQSPAYEQAYRSPQYVKFMEVLKLVEDKLGMKWRPAVTALTQGGISVGFDLPTQGTCVLVKAKDADCAAKARDVIFDLARQQAQTDGKPDPIKPDEYRGIKVYQIGDAIHTTLGPWLITANKSLLLRMIIDNHLDDGKTLGAEEQFQAAMAQRRQLQGRYSLARHE